MDIAIEHEIRQRAYAIWVASGMNEGEAEAHWLHAERSVRIEAEAATISTAARNGKAKPAKTVARVGKASIAKDAVAKVAKTKAAAATATLTKATAATRRPEAGPVGAVA